MTATLRWSFWIPLAFLLAAAAEVSLPVPSPSETAAEQNNRGIALLADHRTDEAVKAFEAAAAAAPAGAVEPRYNRALALYRQRRHDEALAALGALASPRAAVLRARILQALGRQEEAIRSWQEVRRAGGLDLPSLWHLVLLLRQLDQPGPAEEILRDLLVRTPETGAIEAERTAALAELGRIEEALAAARRATAAIGESDPELTSILQDAEAAHQTGRTSEAGTALSMAANVLRSMKGYLAGVDRLSRQGPDSPLAEDPLPFRSTAEPGAPPPPLIAGEIQVRAPGSRALCVTGSGLLAVGPEGSVLLTRDEEGKWSSTRRIPQPATECAAADLDQDGAEEIVLAGAEALLVLWPQGEPARLAGAASAIALVDYDLDGDTDLATAGPAGVHLWRNNRDRTFTDVTGPSGLASAAAGAASGVLAADFTGDGADELYVTRTAGPSLLLGRLREEKVETAGSGVAASGPATAADCDHDGDLDLFTPGNLFTNDGLGRFTGQPLPGTAGATRLGAVDLDLDGFVDLLTLNAAGILGALRGTGACELVPWSLDAPGGIDDVAAGDFDQDGAPDLALLSGGAIRFLESAATGKAIALAAKGTKDNTDALGARVDVLAGRLRLHHEMRRGTQEIGTEGARVLLGVGSRNGAQWIRVRWPNNTWASLAEVAAGPIAVEQSRDLVGSCPFLYAWNGERFAFVTDLLGGSPLGLPLARGVHMPADPDEAVLLPPGSLAERDGRYDLRITVELREMLYLDQVELLAVDHPEGAVVATDDGLKAPPFPPFRLYLAQSARPPIPPITAVDHRGADVLDRLLRRDGRYADGFDWIRFQGYAEPHSVTLDFGEVEHPEHAFLVLTGGYYWSEADNLGMAQASTVHPQLPLLEAWRDGGWQPILDPMPFPGGRSKTIAVDLGGKLFPGPVRLRISTNLRLYLDRILLATSDAQEAVQVQRMAPAEAVLGWHGYSEPGPFDGRVPRPYDYSRVRPGQPFARIEGFYTRYGDTLPLLQSADNAAVILHHGDELALSFSAATEPPPGWVREFLFRSVGWDKDAHPNTETGRTVEPLPFHGMRAYPYSAPERYPWTPRLRELDRLYRTRWIPRDAW